MPKFETGITRTQAGKFGGKSSKNPEYGRKVRSFRKEDNEEGAEVYYRPGKFAVVKGKEMREFTYADRKERGGARQKAFKCASEWCGLHKSESEGDMAKADELGLSTYEIEAAIRQAVSNKWGVRSYVERIYPDAQVAIICIYPDAPMYGGPYAIASETKRTTLRIPYEVEDDAVSLGESEEVKQVYVAMGKALEDLCKNVEEYGADDAAFSALVERKLDNKGMDEEDLAEKTGIDWDLLQDMLSGDVAWSRGDKVRVAGACGIEIKEYLKKEVVFTGRKTEGGYVFGYDEALEKALEDAGEEVEELIGEGLLFLRKDAEADTITVTCEKGAPFGNTNASKHGSGGGEGGGGRPDHDSRYTPKNAASRASALERSASGERKRWEKAWNKAGDNPDAAKAGKAAMRAIKKLEAAADKHRGNPRSVRIDVLDTLHEDVIEAVDSFEHKLGKSSETFPGTRLPHVANTFFFASNGSSEALAKALRDTGSCKKITCEEAGITVCFEKDSKGDEAEIVCEKLDTQTAGAGAETVPQGKMSRKKKEIKFLKADTKELRKDAKERGVVYGIVYSPDVVDLQGEYANEEDIRKAAEDFMSNPRVQVQHGKLSKSKVVYSYVTEDGDKVLGKTFKSGTWIMGVKLSPEDRILYKKGKITGYSMGGTKTLA